MRDIIDEMFYNLYLYVWHNPLDDEDSGAILIKTQDADKVRRFTENASDEDDRATSFIDLTIKLVEAGIPFYEVDDADMYIYTGDA